MSPIEWLIDALSRSCAERPNLRLVGLLIGTDRKAGLVEVIRKALDSGALPTTTWVVEWNDGRKSSREQIIERHYFTSLVWDAGGPGRTDRRSHEAEMEVLWPPKLFEDMVKSQIEELCTSWVKHCDLQKLPQFSRALEADFGDLAIFSWEQKRREVRRDPFLRWFKDSDFARMTSVLTGSPMVTGEALWPKPSELKGLPPREATKRVLKEMFPEDLPKGVPFKRQMVIVGDEIERRGGIKPSLSTYKRACNELEAERWIARGQLTSL